ncbi:MAG: polysaccharide deacetylase 2 family uncharacterized protein YibQ [Gammaproteobacteria bacterium]|jgi:polysaccharide deacetylase 2 family uncharacterized protein YibQ
MLLRLILCYCFATASALADQKPLLSLVVDDLGYSYDRGKASMEIPGDHTFAIIPGTAHGPALSTFAETIDKEIILHLPLQASNSRAAAEKNALDETMDEDQINRQLHTMLSEYQGIAGVNNHMGSYLTSIDYFMRAIMEGINRFNPGLYFLDSRTTALSVAYYEAVDSGIESIQRDIFLDNNYNNVESLQFQFNKWQNIAREKGSAIAIAHPHPSTTEFLTQRLPDIMENFRIVRVSTMLELLNQPETINWQASLGNQNEPQVD